MVILICSLLGLYIRLMHTFDTVFRTNEEMIVRNSVPNVSLMTGHVGVNHCLSFVCRGLLCVMESSVFIRTLFICDVVPLRHKVHIELGWG